MKFRVVAFLYVLDRVQACFQSKLNSSPCQMPLYCHLHTCSNVQVCFPATAEVFIDTVGIGKLALLCEGNTLRVVETLTVKAGTIATFSGCEADIEETITLFSSLLSLDLHSLWWRIVHTEQQSARNDFLLTACRLNGQFHEFGPNRQVETTQLA